MRNIYLTAVLYGWATIFIFIFLSSLFLSILIRFTMITEITLTYLSLAIGIIALLIGGIVAGIKGKEKGWIVGVLTGVGFTLATFLIQYLGYNEAFTMQQLVYHVTYILAAIIGSILGVNVANHNNET